MFVDTSYGGLLKKIDFLELNNITLITGDLKDTVPEHLNKSKHEVLSVNLDCNLYQSYEVCMPIIFENLEPKGYIHLDEYYSLKFLGPKIATDQFLENYSKASLQKNLTRISKFERFFIRKNT